MGEFRANPVGLHRLCPGLGLVRTRALIFLVFHFLKYRVLETTRENSNSIQYRNALAGKADLRLDSTNCETSFLCSITLIKPPEYLLGRLFPHQIADEIDVAAEAVELVGEGWANIHFVDGFFDAVEFGSQLALLGVAVLK